MAKNTTPNTMPEGFAPATLSTLYRPMGASPLIGQVVEAIPGTYRGKEQVTYKIRVVQEFQNGKTVGSDGVVKGDEICPIDSIVSVPERAQVRVLRECIGKQVCIICTGKGQGSGAEGAWRFSVGVKK